MAAAEATEPPSLADWEKALSEVSSWATRSARSASLGEVSLTLGLERGDLGLECASASASPDEGGADFELGDARFERGDVGLRLVLCAETKTAPGKGETDNADQAAEQPRGAMGDEAFQLGNAG